MESTNIEQQILELYSVSPTMSYKDMASVLNCSKSTIQYYFRKNNIIRDIKVQHLLNNTDRNKDILLTDKVKQILVGTLLGDSTISKYRRDCESVKILNSRVSTTHSIKQKEYVKYLQELINQENLKCNYTEDLKEHHSKINNRTIVTFGQCSLSTTRNIVFNSWRDLWYPNNIKIVPRELVDTYLSPLAIAIWFMDDGSKNNCSYYLHTEGFSIEDVNFLRGLLNSKYNINTCLHSMRGKPTIYISAKSRNVFTTLILPYVCNSMKYKLWI